MLDTKEVKGIESKAFFTSEVPQDEIIIPMDFRRHFISLLKILLNESPFKERLKSSPRI